MNKSYLILSLLFLFIYSGCSKDDDLPESNKDGFYSNTLVNANPSLLSGTWSIFQGSYEGNLVDIPATYQECGRDFFQFIENGLYKEYILTTSYECQRQITDFQWDLNDGIISISNAVGQSDEMVITELTSEKLTFKIKIDIDDDGELDILTLLAKRYAPPNDIDLYSYTFQPAPVDSSDDKIKFTWQPYSGFYEFEKYEVYRSINGCTKTSAELLATIHDVSTNFFIDEDPLAQDNICYFLKIYNEKGLLGESQVIEFFTEYLRPTKVGFSTVNPSNTEIDLHWQPYQGNYFSHYEITVRNYTGGTGSGYQEYPVKIINDIETTSYVDKDPPYLMDPVYAIYSYDIFGNRSSEPYTNENVWELDWSRPEVLKFSSIDLISIDKDQPEIYLYGKEKNGNYNLIKFNYQNQQISATANKVPDLMNSINMRVYETGNGKELFFPQGNGLAVYDATNLSFKYKIVPQRSLGFYDFVYLGDNLFAFTDSDIIYTYKRFNGNLEYIDQKNHFSTHFGSYNYHLIALKDKQLLVGHFYEPNSYKFSISETGKISEAEIVNIPIKSHYVKNTFYSAERNYIINLLENKLYSTQTFNLKDSFEKPYFPSGISRNGNLIFGSNNDPEWYPENETIHEKKARIYNLTTGQLNTIETKGYPLMLFENSTGQIISISSGFKRPGLDQSMPKPDIFVEVVR
ncbi:lipocalin family protein [Zunongwangia sp. H14]|uniref:lipocalin family protein n=1 Tax=Zunongwangia sp. H14 TaxID=3240792 RepID=UPI0035622098